MVPDFPFCISEGELRKGAVQLLGSLRPTWSESSLQIKVFTEGLTNKLFGMYVADDPDDVVLFRIYGQNTELLIDRVAEVNTMKLFSAFGCGAPLYATFSNGLCYGFIPGETLDELAVRDETVQRLIAEAFVKIHRLRVDSIDVDNRPVLFPVLKRYLDLIPPSFEQNTLEKCAIPSREALRHELQVLESHLSSLGSPVVFCHNDALLKNIVYDKRKDRVTFIDYEYAGYNYQAFDIGNHFCEFAGMQNMDLSRYPDRKFQLNWLTSYLECWHRGSDKSVGPAIDTVDLERLYVQVNKFALASHFLWGVWGLVQAAYSNIDFDYLSFATGRLNEYFARKEAFLSLELPPLQPST